MTAIIITAIIGVTAVTIYAMKCNTDRAKASETAIVTEITKHVMEKVKDNETMQ